MTRKKKTHNRFFKDLETLMDAVAGFFNTLSVPNDILKNLCTFKWMRAHREEIPN